MSSFDEIRSGLLKKYNVNATGKTGSTNKQSGSTQGTPPQTDATDFQTIRRNLLDKYSVEKTTERQKTVASWGTRFNSTMERISNLSSGSQRTRKNIDGLDSDINSLIRSYDTISEYADRMGIPNAQRYLKQLQEAQRQIKEFKSQFKSDDEWNWYEKYNSQNSDSLQSVLDTLDDGDEKNWLQGYTNQVYNEELPTVDVEASRKKAASLQQLLDAYRQNSRFGTDAKGEAWLQEIRDQYGGEEGLERAISRENRRANLAAQEQDRIRNADRFGNVTRNSDFAQKSAYDPGNTDIGYRYVNGDDWERYLLEKQHGQYVEEFGYHAFDSLTDEEKAVYNYYMNTGDRQSAADYLKHIQDPLNKRKGQQIFADGFKGNAALEFVYGIDAGLDQFRSGVEGMGKMIRGDNTQSAPSATQYASSAMREDLGQSGKKLPSWLGGGTIGQAVYDSVTTTANMVPSILTSTALSFLNHTLGTVAGGAMMGAGAAGSAYQEMIDSGYTVSQARTYGALVGTAEMVMEKLLGGIGKLGGNSPVAKAIAAWAGNVDNALVNLVGRIGGNAISEGMEEGIQEVFSGWLKSQITKEDFYATPADVMYSSLLGAFTGAIFEAPEAAIKVGTQVKGGHDVLKAKGVDSLTQLGRGSENADIQRLAERAANKPSAYNVGGLKAAVSDEVHSQNARDIADSLTRKGMPQKAAQQYGEMISSMLEAGSDTELQRMVMESDPTVGKMLQEIQMPTSSVYQRMTRMDEATGKAPSIDRVAAAYGSQAEDVKNVYRLGETEPGKNLSVADFSYGFQRVFTLGREGAKESALTEEIAPGLTREQVNFAYKLGAEAAAAEAAEIRKRRGDTSAVHLLNEDGSLGSEVKITGIASRDRDETVYRLSNGTTVSEDQLSFEGDNPVLDAVRDLGLDVEAANVVLQATLEGKLTDKVMAAGVEEAFRFGKYGYDPAVLERTKAGRALPENVRNSIYQAGRKQTEESRKQMGVPSKVTPSKKKGEVIFTGDRDKLNKVQRTSLEALEWIAEVTGAKIYVENLAKEDGALGDKNGWYDPKDDSIHIDLNAGRDGTGTLLYTAAHEFVHRMKQNSPARFWRLADFLVAEYVKHGVDVDALVKEQQRLSQKNGTELSYDEAFEEMVADAMEAMFTDSKATQKLGKLKAQDKSLWEEIKSFVQELSNKIRGVYARLKPDSAEARYVLRMKDSVDHLAELFAEGIMDAGAEKNTTGEGGVKYSLNKNAKSELHKALYDKQYRSEVLLRDVSPPIMTTQKGVKNLPMAMNASHIRENVFTEAEAKKLGLRVDGKINYHGLGEDFFLQIVDGLDNVKEAYRGTKNAKNPARRENYFLLISEFKDKKGNVINVPVYINEHAQINKVFFDVNKISTVFGRDNFREYIARQIRNGDLVRIKNRSIKTSESSAPIAEVYGKDASMDSIDKSRAVVKEKNSIRKKQPSLETQNKKLREDVDRLRELLKLQGKVTNGTKFKHSSVEAAARYLKGKFNVSGDAKELAKILNGFYEYIASDRELTWESIKDQAGPAVDWLLDHEKFRRSQYAQEVLDAMKGRRFALDEKQRAEAEHMHGSYGAYQKLTRGMVSSNAENSLDSFWQEMATDYPMFFDADISSADMPRALLEILDQLENMEDMDFAMDWRMKEQSMLQEVYDSYWRVDNLQTVADRNQKKINELKGRHIQKMTELRQDHAREVQKLKDARKQNVESRGETAIRNKIRHVVKELEKVLLRGNKKRNVKQGMRGVVEDAIASASILFTKEVSDEELLLNGIQTDLIEPEVALLNRASDLLDQISIEKSRLPAADQLAEANYDEIMAHADADTAAAAAETTASLFAQTNRRKLNALEKEYREVMKDLRPVFARERNRRNGALVEDVLNKLAASYKELKNSEYSYLKEAYSEEVYEYLNGLQDKVKGTIIRDMNREQLQTVYNAYKMVLTTIRNANKAFVDGRSIEAEAQQVVQEFRSRKKPGNVVGVVAKNLANAAGWKYEKLYYALKRINSPTLTKLFGMLAESENVTMRDIQEAKAFQMEQVEKYGYNDWDIDKKIDHTFVDNTGQEFRLTLGEIMALYAYSRREGADKNIEIGGFTFGKTALTDAEPATTYKLTADQCAKITGILTGEQKSFAEAMQKYLSKDMGAKGNEVSMKLYGIEMFGEENYFPLHIAGEYKAVAQESQAKAQAGFQTMTNAGFTKARNINSTAPIVLENFMDVWADHVNEMSRYHGAVPALEDIRRVMNYSVYSEAMESSVSVKAAMTNAYGEQAVNYFDDLYREANSGAITDKMDDLPRKMLSAFRKNSVAYSASVVIQQPASIYRARALVDRKYFGKHGFFTLTGGVLRILNRKKWDAAYAEMMKYAPGVTMAKEIGGFDTSTGGSIRSYLLDTEKSFTQSMKHDTLTGKAGSVLGLVDDNPIANLPNVADKIAWIEMWEAVKRETVDKNRSLSTDTEAFWQKVGERFTEVVRATQVYDSMFSKSPMLKSRNLAAQYLVSFMNEPNTVANIAENAIRDLTRGEYRAAGKAAAALVTSIVTTNLLKSLVYAMRDDDEDETAKEKYISAVASSLISDINPLNYIPYTRDLWSMWEGYDVERPDVSVIADVINAIRNLQKISDEFHEDMTPDQLEAWDTKADEARWRVAETLSPLFGIPLKNVRRDVLSVINTAGIARSAEPNTARGTTYAWEEGVSGVKRTDKQQLYEARIAGDQEHAARVEARYDDEKSANAAVKSAIREAFMERDIDLATANQYLILHAGVSAAEAHWTVDKWEYTKEHGSDDGYGKYNTFFDAVESGENLQGVVKEYADYGVTKSTLSGQITERFSQQYMEMNQKERQAFRKKLEAAYTACGYKQEDAADKLDEWDFEAKHGLSYNEMVADYKDGVFSEEEMKAILINRGLTAEEAEDRMSGWDFEVQYGFSYSARDKAYKEGKISAAELRTAMIEFGDMTETEANNYIHAYDWQIANPQYNLTVSDVLSYTKPIEALGYSVEDSHISPNVYVEYKNKVSKCKGEDADGDGRADNNTVKNQKMDVINELPLSDEQKDVLYYLNGWAKSKIYNAPWH